VYTNENILKKTRWIVRDHGREQSHDDRSKNYGFKMRPLKNVQFCSIPRKTKILTAGIH